MTAALPSPPGSGTRAFAAWRDLLLARLGTIAAAANRLDRLAVAADAVLALSPAERVVALGAVAKLAAGTRDPAVWGPCFALLDRAFSGDLLPEDRARLFPLVGKPLLEIVRIADEPSVGPPSVDDCQEARLASRLLGELSTRKATAALVALCRRKPEGGRAASSLVAAAGLYRVADPDSAPLLAGMLRNPAAGLSLDREAIVRALVASGAQGVQELEALLLGSSAVHPGPARDELVKFALCALADARGSPTVGTALASIRSALWNHPGLPKSRRAWSYLPPVFPAPSSGDVRRVLDLLTAGKPADAERFADFKGVTEIPAGDATELVVAPLLRALARGDPVAIETGRKLVLRLRPTKGILTACRRVAAFFADADPARMKAALALLRSWRDAGLVTKGDMAAAVTGDLVAALPRAGQVVQWEMGIFLLSLHSADANGPLVSAIERGEANPGILEYLDSPDAIRTLGNLARNSTIPGVRQEACVSLGQRGRPGLDVLIGLLDEPFARDADGKPSATGEGILGTLVYHCADPSDLEEVDRRISPWPDLVAPLDRPVRWCTSRRRREVLARFLSAHPDSVLRGFLVGALDGTETGLPASVKAEIEARQAKARQRAAERNR